jgi:hypothetical protein
MPAPLSGSFSLLPGREVTMKLHKGKISLKSFHVPISRNASNPMMKYNESRLVIWLANSRIVSIE